MQKDYDEKKYFMHYLKHTYFVVLAWKSIQDILIKNDLINEKEFNKINELILWHDNSKISKKEWTSYARMFYSIKNQNMDDIKKEFKEASKRHKKNNLHHFESLKDYKGPDFKCYIIEMICDYIAMGWEFNNYIFEYYEQNKEKINLPILYQEYLDNVLEIIKEVNFINEPLTQKRISYLYYK